MSIHWSDLTKDGRIEAIKAVYEPGMSAGEIAAAIGGVTRNAVIGMYTRHRPLLTDCGLRPFRTCGRSRSPRRERATPKAVFAKRSPAFVPAPIDRSPLPEAHLVGRPIAQMSGFQCRWPVNDAAPGETHLFCGLPTDAKYCSHHTSRAYRGRP